MTEQEIKNKLAEDKNNFFNAFEKIEIRLSGLLVKNISQNRLFLSNVAIISSAAVGLIFLVDKNLFSDKNFLMIGFVVYLCVIILIFIYLSNIFSKENSDLLKEKDKNAKIYQENDKISMKYLLKASEGAITDDDYNMYIQELIGSEGFKNINEDLDEEKEARANRGKQSLDYFNELIIFLFISASFFVVLSTPYVNFNLFQVVLLEFLFFIFVFFPIFPLFFKYLNKFFSWLINNKLKINLNL